MARKQKITQNNTKTRRTHQDATDIQKKNFFVFFG